MQSPNEKGQQSSLPELPSAQSPELSEAFRALLGLQSPEGPAGTQEVDPAAQVPPQASDPWSHLLQSQGMQSIDLQKLSLRDLRAVVNDDDDVEHALNVMREATGHLPAVDGKSREL